MSVHPEPSGPEKITYEGRIIEVVEQPMKVGDKVVNFEFARRSPGVRLIIQRPDGKLILSKEFRAELQGHDVRLPGGKVFDSLKEYGAFLTSKGDTVEQAKKAALKEAREEVGIEAKDAKLFAVSKCGATVEWDLYYFVITDFSEGGQTLGSGEVIEIQPTSPDEARAMCLDGRIQEERSALMLLRYLKN